MDTETVANLCLKALNAGNVGEAEAVVEPSYDNNYMEYKSSFVYCLALTLIPRLIGELDASHSQSHTERSVHWVLNGVGGPNVSALAKHVACICTQVYAFESSIPMNTSGYVYVDGENLMYPDSDIIWNAETLPQLVNNVRALYAQGTMSVFNAEPTVVVYHKTGKGSNRLIDDYPLQLNVCGLRCGIDCRDAGKELDDMLLVVAASTRARLSYVPVVVYSHDRYRWLGANIGLDIIFARPEKSGDGFILRIEGPNASTFDFATPVKVGAYGNAWDDLAGLGAANTNADKSMVWEHVAGNVIGTGWYVYIPYIPMLSVTVAISMLGALRG